MGMAVYDVIVVGGGVGGGGVGGSTLARAMAMHGVRCTVSGSSSSSGRCVSKIACAANKCTREASPTHGNSASSTCYGATGDTSFPGSIGTSALSGSSTVIFAPRPPQHAPMFTLYHPAMQEILLQAAMDAGAHVHRGAHVRDVRPGAPPEVVVAQDGRIETLRARLVVGADGRTSMTRRWGLFTVRRDPDRLLVAGLLFDDMSAPEDTSHAFTMRFGRTALLFPQGRGRVRAYFVCQRGDPRLQGNGDVARFVMENVRAGVPAEYFAKARAAGHLATFDAADTWVDHPYAEGVALIGDAAASNDPSYGEGLSLTLRDVRVLREALRCSDNWDTAGRAYAKEHDRHYGVIHTVTGWFGDIFYATGSEAEARRRRALPLIARDGGRVPDHIVSGPDLPLSETTRRRLFGEE